MFDYNKFKNLTPVRTVKELEVGLTGKHRTSGADKSMTIFILLIVLFGIILFLNYNTITSLIPINPIFVIGLYIVFALYVSISLSSLANKNLTEQTKAKIKNEGENEKFHLNKVWRITVGGIVETLPLKSKSYNGSTLSIKYETDAFIIKFLMDSVADADESDDIRHYQGYTRILDLIVQNNYDIEILTLRYNPELDKIWGNSSRKIATASKEFGENFSLTRSLLEKRLFDFSANFSTIDVQYIIVKSTSTSSISCHQLLNQILANVKGTRLKIEGVSTIEFKQLIEQYFCTEVSFEDISTYVSSTNLPGETKIISYKIGKTLFQMNEPYKYTFHTPLINANSGFQNLAMNKGNKSNNTVNTKQNNKQLTKLEEEIKGLEETTRDRTFSDW